jgi:hypothetical protein
MRTTREHLGRSQSGVGVFLLQLAWTQPGSNYNGEETMKEKPVCAHCGSESIVVDAYAEWDNDAQDWVLQNVFSEYFCGDCESETSANWIQETQP